MARPTGANAATTMWLLGFLLLLLPPRLPKVLSFGPADDGPRRIALVTGGTRGIGRGISEALAGEGYDLLLTYNTNEGRAAEFAESVRDRFGETCRRVECVGGDLSLPASRDAVFERLDSMLGEGAGGGGGDGGGGAQGSRLAVMVHNAGQYVGITADNSDGLDGSKRIMFGDGSLLGEDGKPNLDTLEYYHRLYGTAFVDLCERSLARMDDGAGGSLVGISSSGGDVQNFGPDPSYSMPGAGKCLMEFSMRIYALQAASRNINCNCIVPGVTKTEAWTKLAQSRGLPDEKQMMEGIVERMSPSKKMQLPEDIGNVVKFLASDAGRCITGMSLPADGGLHLRMGV